MRTGAHALTLLSSPLNVQALMALRDGPRPLPRLRKEVGSPPPTTMRNHLLTLTEFGIIERFRSNEFPPQVDFALGGAGRDLLSVAGAINTWLVAAPDGPVELGTVAAKRSIKALVDGWATGVVRALAAKPLTLTELDRLISRVSYPTLERRLAAMREAGQLEALSANGNGRRQMVTNWLRQAIGPLAVASRWEQMHPSDHIPPPGRIDVEAAFLLAVPRLRLPNASSGSCRLAVELTGGEVADPTAGVVIDVEDGRVIGCSSRLGREVGAWVSGTPSGWFRAVVDGFPDQLELGGDNALAAGVLDGLQRCPCERLGTQRLSVSVPHAGADEGNG